MSGMWQCRGVSLGISAVDPAGRGTRDTTPSSGLSGLTTKQTKTEAIENRFVRTALNTSRSVRLWDLLTAVD